MGILLQSMKYLLILTMLWVSCPTSWAEEEVSSEKPTVEFSDAAYVYKFTDREDHTFSERAGHLAFIFGLSTVLYPATQPDILKSENGSWRKYGQNFGRLVFDHDEQFWNYLVHPLSGSQKFLFFRTMGYSEMDAVMMTFFSAVLFEFTIEVYSEPASVQDLFNTPIIGAVLGIGIGKASHALLNSGSGIGKFFGHLINPSSFFFSGEKQAFLVPDIRPNTKSLRLVMEF